MNLSKLAYLGYIKYVASLRGMKNLIKVPNALRT